ncbi:MAG TPA: hypothetical protein VIF39_04175 [Hyphomicrobium sp.]|jgi:hypothetical protein
MGWFRSLNRKSPGSQEVSALLVARNQLLGKLLDVEFSILGILCGFRVTRKSFAPRVRELCAGQPMLEQISAVMLAARSALQTEHAKLHKAMLSVVRGRRDLRPADDCAGVGSLVAITFKMTFPLFSGHRKRLVALPVLA